MRKPLFAISILIMTLAVALPVAHAQQAPGNPAAGAFPASAEGKFLTNFTFDADNMGWLETYVGRADGTGYDWLYGNDPAGHTNSEGNPPGSIFETVSTDLDQRAYWLGYYGEPQSLGDLADAYLQTDVYSSMNWQTIANGSDDDDGNVYARWVISTTCASDPTQYDMFISNRAASIDLNSFSGWQTFTVDMLAINFFRWPNGVCGTYGFEEVLQNYDQVGLYIFSGTDDVENINGGVGTWVTVENVSRLAHYGAHATEGTATWGLDNFTAEGNSVPDEPMSFGGVKVLFR